MTPLPNPLPYPRELDELLDGADPLPAWPGVVTSSNKSFKARLAHAAQSTRMWSHALASCRSRRHSVAIAPSAPRGEGASSPRAWQLAPALRRLGWRVLMLAPEASLAERQRVLRLWRPDVLLLQESRHPLNRPSLYPGVTCVFDQDDADDLDGLDSRLREDIVGCCEGSVRVIAGSSAVGHRLGRHNPEVDVIWSSTTAPRVQAQRKPSQREPIVAWAHTHPLDHVAELAYVQRVMKGVARVRPDAELWLFGCDEDAASAARIATWLHPLEAAGIRCRAWPSMPERYGHDLVAQASVGLLPVCIEDEPLPEGKSLGLMLAYLAGEVPVVASNNVDHPLFFESGRNGFLVRDSIDCAQAVVNLLDDKHLRDDIAAVALQDFRMRWSTGAVAAQVSAALLRAIGAPRLRGSPADQGFDDGLIDDGPIDDWLVSDALAEEASNEETPTSGRFIGARTIDAAAARTVARDDDAGGQRGGSHVESTADSTADSTTNLPVGALLANLAARPPRAADAGAPQLRSASIRASSATR